MSIPSTGSTDDGPHFPFEPPSDRGPPPTAPYYTALKQFVDSGMNGRPDPNLTTLMNLSPDSLLQVCRTTLRESRETRDLSVSVSSNRVAYLSQGFQQDVRFVFSDQTQDAARWAPLNATVLQYDTSDDAYAAFTDRIGSFQSVWDKTFRRNREVGNYAFQTSNSILWQRWTTVVILQADLISPEVPLSVTGSSTVQSIDFVKFAGNLDPMMASQNGPLSSARRAGMQNVNIPSVEVDEAAKCTIEFTNGAHKVRSVKLLEYGKVNLGGEIDAGGQFWIIGQSAGTAKVRARVAQAESLKVTTVDFTVTVNAAALAAAD